ncbi:oligosaccharyltransferase complex subunit ostc-B [Strongylocentrotus purpuratus]|uniref:Oligosaccharyltransferase complex subunit n=1 Tax=Strongylocentrotus purpuratus TaxID=7668 RepID=A0A7M7TGX2_STRPU|nr:oligosaccharyltransferase complex subunit ostc-B [Strongylocentrotus purpuratus]|eukprot:XP_788490.1 PREDICTED: oligosaccharyltransferase complex subunit ostc-B [Strongylocentrotus purpuratus]
MERVYAMPFTVLECPHLKLKKPSWFHAPSAMTVYFFVLASYFLVTGGVIYDVIVEPPSVGSTTDENGHQKPVAFMPYRVNGQYIMEGLASSFLFTIGGLGFVVLDKSNSNVMPKLNRFLLLLVGFLCILTSFFMCRVFMRMKLPGYLQG